MFFYSACTVQKNRKNAEPVAVKAAETTAQPTWCSAFSTSVHALKAASVTSEILLAWLRRSLGKSMHTFKIVFRSRTEHQDYSSRPSNFRHRNCILLVIHAKNFRGADGIAPYVLPPSELWASGRGEKLRRRVRCNRPRNRRTCSLRR